MAPEKDKPEPKPKAKEEAPAAKEAEAIPDEEVMEIIGTTFGDYAKIAPLLPSFKTLEGDLLRGIEWLDPKKRGKKPSGPVKRLTSSEGSWINRWRNWKPT